MPTPDKASSFIDAAALSRLTRLTLTARLPMLGSISGLHRSATRGSSVEFAEYRKYVPGDDIKHLDWRVFARTDRFYMKEFEADTNLRCYLVIDASASMGFDSGGGSRFDYARRLAATLAHLLVGQGDSVGLLCFNDRSFRDIPPRHSPVHLKAIYDTLAEIEPRGATDIARAMDELAERVRPRALVVLFSDLLQEPEPLLTSFRHMRFRRHDLAVFHLMDKQEFDFDFSRPIRFQDLETPLDLIADPALVREGYLEALHAHMNALKTGCREFAADYRMTTIDQDYEALLASFLLERLGKHKGGRK